MLKADDATGRWLELVGVDCQVYHPVFPCLMAKTGAQHSQMLLGVAKLARHAETCVAK